jgi:hypothetical protein
MQALKINGIGQDTAFAYIKEYKTRFFSVTGTTEAAGIDDVDSVLIAALPHMGMTVKHNICLAAFCLILYAACAVFHPIIITVSGKNTVSERQRQRQTRQCRKHKMTGIAVPLEIVQFLLQLRMCLYKAAHLTFTVPQMYQEVCLPILFKHPLKYGVRTV